MPLTRHGQHTAPEKTIFLKAAPDLYTVLDMLRRAKQRASGQRVTLNSVVLELVLTHPYVAPKLPAPLPEDAASAPG